VQSTSPGEKAGIQPGDEIVKIGPIATRIRSIWNEPCLKLAAISLSQ